MPEPNLIMLNRMSKQKQKVWEFNKPYECLPLTYPPCIDPTYPLCQFVNKCQMMFEIRNQIKLERQRLKCKEKAKKKRSLENIPNNQVQQNLCLPIEDPRDKQYLPINLNEKYPELVKYILQLMKSESSMKTIYGITFESCDLQDTTAQASENLYEILIPTVIESFLNKLMSTCSLSQKDLDIFSCFLYVALSLYPQELKSYFQLLKLRGCAPLTAIEALQKLISKLKPQQLSLAFVQKLTNSLNSAIAAAELNRQNQLLAKSKLAQQLGSTGLGDTSPSQRASTARSTPKRDDEESLEMLEKRRREKERELELENERNKKGGKSGGAKSDDDKSKKKSGKGDKGDKSGKKSGKGGKGDKGDKGEKSSKDKKKDKPTGGDGKSGKHKHEYNTVSVLNKQDGDLSRVGKLPERSSEEKIKDAVEPERGYGNSLDIEGLFRSSSTLHKEGTMPLTSALQKYCEKARMDGSYESIRFKISQFPYARVDENKNKKVFNDSQKVLQSYMIPRTGAHQPGYYEPWDVEWPWPLLHETIMARIQLIAKRLPNPNFSFLRGMEYYQATLERFLEMQSQPPPVKKNEKPLKPLPKEKTPTKPPK